MAIKNKTQKTRFIAVGGVNTLLDFGILFALKSLGLPAISANIVSTSAAFCFSFLANKKYTFKTDSTNIKREIVLFFIITLFGLWVLQTIVINVVSYLLSGLNMPGATTLFVAKLCATIVSLTWNYIMYSRVVFRKID